MTAASPVRQGLAIWLTGLPASGKTTLAALLAERLQERGRRVEILDADTLRGVLTPRPTYTAAERDWFYDILAYLAELLTRHGVTVLIAATAHRSVYRDRARKRLPRFAEVYVKCPLKLCRLRDPKGLYALARQGRIGSLPGEQEAYEVPDHPDAVADTERLAPSQSAADVIAQLERAGLLEGVGN